MEGESCTLSDEGVERVWEKNSRTIPLSGTRSQQLGLLQYGDSMAVIGHLIQGDMNAHCVVGCSPEEGGE